MKSLQQRINEGIFDADEHALAKEIKSLNPENKEELIKIMSRLIKDQGNKANLNIINTSQITDMSYLFKDFEEFEGDISQWDVSNVKNMSHMFHGIAGASSGEFRSDISNWDVSNVEDMSGMFWWVVIPDLDLNKWNVSKVKNMSHMFSDGYARVNISKWNVSNVEDMSEMFGSLDTESVTSFTGDISKWIVSQVKNMEGMFAGNSDFA